MRIWRLGALALALSLFAQPALAGGLLLYEGARGQQVADLQVKLRRVGLPVRVDGIFGTETLIAVIDLQIEAGIRVDGLVGPETLGALDRALAALDKPAPVARIAPPPPRPVVVVTPEPAIPPSGVGGRRTFTYLDPQSDTYLRQEQVWDGRNWLNEGAPVRVRREGASWVER